MHPPRGSMECRDRCAGVENSAAGIVDDVAQEAKRATQRAVLIVDGAIHMVAIGACDQRGGFLEVTLVPGNNFKFRVDFGREGLQIVEIQIKEFPPMAAKIMPPHDWLQ